jgi:uncharacterized membrane protein
MTPTIDPIAPWYIVFPLGGLIIGLTLWAYTRRLRGTTGAWRWIALGLRLAAVVLCVLATLKPSLLLMRKVKQTATLVFLIDNSESMRTTDEANGESRWNAAKKALDESLERLGSANSNKLEIKAQRFDKSLRDYKTDDKTRPEGHMTAIGTALEEVIKQAAGTRILSIVLLSDGTSNGGNPPLSSAQRLKGLLVPVVTVGFGSENVGKSSRDLAAREIVAGPTVFVKNKLKVRGTIAVRGYPPDEPVTVELYVEDGKRPISTKDIKIKPGESVIPINDLEWTPQAPGETKLTLRVKPKSDEQIPTNNEISTYVTVQKGGLAVLLLQGPNFSWEPKYMTLSLDSSPEIQVELRVIRRPVSEDPSVLSDEELTPGKYDVIILKDVPAAFLTPLQQRLIVRGVQRNGTGLMMLGGRSSFGAGGWAGTEVGDIMPTELHPGDGQVEPPDGLTVRPNARGLDSYVMRLSPNPAENARIWAALPPISTANRLGKAKQGANVMATQSDGEPLMVSEEVPKGRVLAFGGETWPSFTTGGESLQAHRKFWRQAILWLAHKEDSGESQVRIALDRRRLELGQKLDVTASARDAKNEPIADVKFEVKVEFLGTPGSKPVPVDLFNQGNESRGAFFPTGQPGEYRITATGIRDGKPIGSDNARFLVYQDDRELDNPAADHALLRQIAQITGGKSLAPEQLDKYLKGLDGEVMTDTVVQKEVRLWDNWPFFLIFCTLLTAEWFIRKRHGWV